jgi:protein gp37
MAQTTGIAWTDATVNFVIGCEEVGPGCLHCYAKSLAARHFGITFGPDGERRPTVSGFKDPYVWNRHRERGVFQLPSGKKVPKWVFACSLSDFFDNKWPPEVRTRAWKVIRECNQLNWQIVTKRIPNVKNMLPRDWDDGKNYPHVGIIATCVTQGEVDRDRYRLIALKGTLGVRWIGLSIEPQLERVSVRDFGRDILDWVICGGESKQHPHPARPFQIDWAAQLMAECHNLSIPFFMKQMGDHCMWAGRKVDCGRAGADMDKWPRSLRVQQMPKVYSAAAVA